LDGRVGLARQPFRVQDALGGGSSSTARSMRWRVIPAPRMRWPEAIPHSSDRNWKRDPMIHIDIDPMTLLLILAAIRIRLRW